MHSYDSVSKTENAKCITLYILGGHCETNGAHGLEGCIEKPVTVVATRKVRKRLSSHCITL